MKNKYVPVPDMPWQIEEYSRQQDFKFTLPYQFLLLCKLLGTTPQQMIIDFMDDLSFGSWKSEGRHSARIKLKEYVEQRQYGSQFFDNTEINQIFEELRAIALLYPKNAEEGITDLHVEWRKHYHQYWFNKWYQQKNRK